MKRVPAVLVLVFAFMMPGALFGASVEKESRVSSSVLKNILGRQLVDFSTIDIARGDGKLFFLTRDPDTRGLSWHLVDPSANKVLKSGSCPFKVFTQSAVSPDGTSALVFTKYPSALWHLSVSAGKWTMVYQNPQKEGLAILTFSPLTYVEPLKAYTLLDLWDAGHFVIDSCVSLVNLSSLKVEQVTSLRKLKEKALAAVKPESGKDLSYQVGLIRYGEGEKMLYTLKAVTGKGKKARILRDYLLEFTAPDKVSWIKTPEGGVLPLDLAGEPSQALFTLMGEKKGSVILFKEGKSHVVIEEKALAGRILKNGLIGIAALNGPKLSIYLVKQGEKPSPVLSLGQASSVLFTDDGKRLVLKGKSEIAYYKISP
ncbi:MAG: hypothetical protein RDV48_01325 [Candidatus Eremiobacteraeota bacterium]|nr:hypothetical protein [Candidatus Eremiobacteraeota bacterium]